MTRSQREKVRATNVYEQKENGGENTHIKYYATFFTSICAYVKIYKLKEFHFRSSEML